MTEVMVDKQVAERLQSAAKARGIAISELIERATELYLTTVFVAQEHNGHSVNASDEWEQQAEKIAQEQGAYEAQHATLYHKFVGQFIAIHEGTVVDHDVARVTLSRRIRATYGKQPILITPVLAKPQRVFRVSRPRLIKS